MRVNAVHVVSAELGVRADGGHGPRVKRAVPGGARTAAASYAPGLEPERPDSACWALIGQGERISKLEIEDALLDLFAYYYTALGLDVAAVRMMRSAVYVPMEDRLAALAELRQLLAASRDPLDVVAREMLDRMASVLPAQQLGAMQTYAHIDLKQTMSFHRKLLYRLSVALIARMFEANFLRGVERVPHANGSWTETARMTQVLVPLRALEGVLMAFELGEGARVRVQLPGRTEPEELPCSHRNMPFALPGNIVLVPGQVVTALQPDVSAKPIGSGGHALGGRGVDVAEAAVWRVTCHGGLRPEAAEPVGSACCSLLADVVCARRPAWVGERVGGSAQQPTRGSPSSLSHKQGKDGSLPASERALAHVAEPLRDGAIPRPSRTVAATPGAQGGAAASGVLDAVEPGQPCGPSTLPGGIADSQPVTRDNPIAPLEGGRLRILSMRAQLRSAVPYELARGWVLFRALCEHPALELSESHQDGEHWMAFAGLTASALVTLPEVQALLGAYDVDLAAWYADGGLCPARVQAALSPLHVTLVAELSLADCYCIAYLVLTNGDNRARSALAARPCPRDRSARPTSSWPPHRAPYDISLPSPTPPAHPSPLPRVVPARSWRSAALRSCATRSRRSRARTARAGACACGT
jgi:hypothetical protein